MTYRRWLVPLLFSLAFAARTASLMMAQSPCVDELAHIPAGYIYWHWKNFYPNREHPVLVKLVSGAGFALAEKLPGGKWDPAQPFFSGSDLQSRLFKARWAMLIFPLALLAVVHATLRRLFDEGTAALSTVVLTLFPVFIAHSVFVHTDVAAALFYMAPLSLLVCWSRDRRRLWLLLLAAVLALGMLAKYSLTLAVANSVAAVGLLSERGERFRAMGRFIGAFAALAAGLLWLGYAGQRGVLLGPHPGWVEWIPIPNFYKEGWRLVWHHTLEGHPNVFLTQFGFKGHLAYFPLAFLLKTPLPVLLGMIAGIFIVFRRRYPWRWIWLLFAGTYWISSMSSNINIGVRHILPVLVVMWIPLAAAVRFLLERNGGRWVAGLMLAWLAAVSFAHWGSELAYFNEAVGSRDGWKYFGDSNVDWGQQVGPLAAFVKQNKIAPLYHDLFGNLPLSVYGVEAAPVSDATDGNRLRPGWYAISAHALAVNGTSPYVYFRQARANQSFGNSIYLFRVD
ncbi:MAG: phospholipid carrier-dependent glycosyltransferase [Acidobacteria bacterium]|nr:phospholipid carrier-dependent glycosyltransferase [Acidobacteriota bacterium]